MFKRIVNLVEVLALVGAVVFVVMLFANDPGGGGSASGGGSTGQQLYAENCATCHGADGQGSVGPQLAGRVTQRFPNIDDQIAVVTAGTGGMPSFKQKLTAKQIQQVVEYTRTGLSG
jgi:mono/diheme cytochrome c family protein